MERDFPWRVLEAPDEGTVAVPETRAAGVPPPGTRRAVAIGALGIAALLAAAVWQLGGQACRANGRFCADPRNPCGYAHTSPDLLNLVRRVEQIAAVHPAHRDMVIEVCADPYDTWPLPWYFRKFRNVGYWTRAGDVPAGLRPAIIVTSMDQEPAVAAKLGEDWQPELFAVRPMVFLTLRTQKEFWDKFLETRAKPKAP